MSIAPARRPAIVSALAALATSVSLLAIDVTVENNPSFDFTTLHTWATNPKGAGNAVQVISPDDDSTQIKKNFETRILPIVQQGLVARGFRQAAEGDADFYVTCYVLVTAGTAAQVAGQFISPVPDWGIPPFAPSTSSLSTFPRGSLILDITPRSTMEVVWRGVARADLKWDDTDARREKHVRDAVKQLLAKFPPKPSKKVDRTP